MPKLSLNASKKTKHTPAGEIPVDWGCEGCFANGVGDGLGNSANRIGGNPNDSAIGIEDGSGNSVDRIEGHSGHSVDRIEGRVGTRASGVGGFICAVIVPSYSPQPFARFSWPFRPSIRPNESPLSRPNGSKEPSPGLSKAMPRDCRPIQILRPEGALENAF
jgi:hypothetical protein